MAITSKGYPGTINPGADHAEFAVKATGRHWAFLDATDFKVAVNPSGTRALTVQPGTAVAEGVTTKSSAVEAITLDAPSGTSQWFCVVLRFWFDNSGTFISRLEVVPGSVTRAVPTLTQTVGSDYKIPIALARVTSTDAQVQDVVDLRLIAETASGFFICNSDLAMNFLVDAEGCIVYRADESKFYRRILSGSGSKAWLNETEAMSSLAAAVLASARNKATITGFGNSVSGWSSSAVDDRSTYRSRLTREFDHVDLFLALRRTSSTITPTSSGNIADMTVFNIDEDYWPRGVVVANGQYAIASGTLFPCLVHILPNGAVTLSALQPGVPLPARSEGLSLRVSASYDR